MADDNPAAGDWIFTKFHFWYEKCGAHLITPSTCGQKELVANAKSHGKAVT
jgi:hypothetical protein